MEEFFPEPIMMISLTLVTRMRESRQAWEKCLQPQLSQISVREGKTRERKKIVLLPTTCWWEVSDRDAFASLVYILEGKKTPHMPY